MVKDLYNQGVSIREIARQTGYDRKTVRAIIAGPLQVARSVRRAKVRKLDPYRRYLEQGIEAGVLNAQKLYQELVAQGYTGKDRQVRQFVQPFRQARQRQTTVRFETAPGEQAQGDWGSFGTLVHQGRQRRLYAFLMTLGWSRTRYLEFTVSAALAWWLRCHLQAFHYFGGVPKTMLHDNLKTAVLAHGADGVVHWQPRYLEFAHDYGFTPRACQPYRAQTKGKVERMAAQFLFQLISRRYLKGSIILTSNKSFADWGDIFADQVLATALLDRLLHHATTVNIRGNSYRLRKKRKAGVFTDLPAPEQEKPTH